MPIITDAVGLVPISWSCVESLGLLSLGGGGWVAYQIFTNGSGRA